uniref:Uncharacterized protein n=1 Tax=Utricularia reniformis TaxID=192314 RepID=A0A1Y0B0L0_9LAMI|nr:hypothetical protein AEK19_MT0739 [Utricularia reniformis]ART30982.1 hypothetical protein AEK19_MT0739 [Utricularia reniformis]
MLDMWLPAKRNGTDQQLHFIVSTVHMSIMLS